MNFPPYTKVTQQQLIQTGDPVRYLHFALALHTLDQQGIDGEFAEVGVYRGETSRILAKLAPRRVLHLFDTFKGFPKQEATEGDNRFQDTALSELQAAFSSNNNIIFHAGHFPDTTRGLEENKFAFVLLDLDLYTPTIAALEFFYPRLVPGGFIFIHDYNSPESDQAMKKAVRKYFGTVPHSLIEIPDRWGSALLRKG